MRGIALATAAVSCVALFTISACASPASYMGISLRDPARNPGLASLAERASQGDKRAQLELGIAFEEGRGVSRDFIRAERLYAAAAADSDGKRWVYQPPLHGTSGRVVSYQTGSGQAGLAEARQRLLRIRSREAQR